MRIISSTFLSGSSSNKPASIFIKAFSKKIENHRRSIALWIVYHNFIWQTIRTGERAATAHGLLPEFWNMEHLVRLTNDFVRERDALRAKKVGRPKKVKPPPPELPAGIAPFWVFENRVLLSCKVHRASCVNCRNGKGKGGKLGRGTWHGFETEPEAVAAALALHPDRTSTCNMCLGRYRTRGTKKGRRY